MSHRTIVPPFEISMTAETVMPISFYVPPDNKQPTPKPQIGTMAPSALPVGSTTPPFASGSTSEPSMR